jgi:hypothetical protein
MSRLALVIAYHQYHVPATDFYVNGFHPEQSPHGGEPNLPKDVRNKLGFAWIHEQMSLESLPERSDGSVTTSSFISFSNLRCY